MSSLGPGALIQGYVSSYDKEFQILAEVMRQKSHWQLCMKQKGHLFQAFYLSIFCVLENNKKNVYPKI